MTWSEHVKSLRQQELIQNDLKSEQLSTNYPPIIVLANALCLLLPVITNATLLPLQSLPYFIEMQLRYLRCKGTLMQIWKFVNTSSSYQNNKLKISR